MFPILCKWLLGYAQGSERLVATKSQVSWANAVYTHMGYVSKYWAPHGSGQITLSRVQSSSAMEKAETKTILPGQV